MKAMTHRLDYETPSEAPRGPWHARIPLTVFVLLIVVPTLVFTRGGRTIPGEKWRWDELFLPAAGCPIAMALATWSFSASPPRRRRIGLCFVVAFAIAMMAGTFMRSVTHW